MKIERLRNKKNKLIFLCGCLMVVVLLITVVFKGSKAKYRSSQIIPLITNKPITNKVPSFTTMGIYLEDSTGTEIKNGKKYKKQETIPSEGFIINETNSYCEKFNSATNTNEKNNNAKLYTNIMGKHSMEGINKGDKCYIYFDKGTNNYISAKQFLLGMWGYEDISTITERTDFDTVRLDGGNKVYKAPDDNGTSYYLVGNPSNNWVKFAGYYWRIVRINGNGSLRLIYQGSTSTSNGIWAQSSYNSNRDGAYYVGFMYSNDTRTGFNNSSDIKTRLEDFYERILKNYDDKIDKDAGFCNDRTVTSGDGIKNGYSTFSASNRLNTKKTPQLKCPEPTNDLFTVNTSNPENKGNKKLTKPIGLISADEIAMGGLVFGIIPTTRNMNMYDINFNYWTVTPYYGDSGCAQVMFVGSTGALGVNNVNWPVPGIRPVINLKKDVTFSKGNGSISSPFEI